MVFGFPLSDHAYLPVTSGSELDRRTKNSHLFLQFLMNIKVKLYTIK